MAAITFPFAPSRHDNPFATCWTRPGALEFRFFQGESAEQLVAKLAAQNWRGAIVGPHGSGKSALLEALKPALKAAGCEVQSFTVRGPCATACGAPLDFNIEFGTARSNTCASVGQQAVPFLQSVQQQLSRAVAHTGERQALVIIDGYEQLGWWKRLRVMRFCRRTRLGLLVTAHAPTNIATLIRLVPDRHLVEQLVADLATRVSTPITPIDVAASHACHGSNVREVFFDLYDRHERLRRAERTRGHQRA